MIRAVLISRLPLCMLVGFVILFAIVKTTIVRRIRHHPKVDVRVELPEGGVLCFGQSATGGVMPLLF